tara:strand:- start:22739 stop:23416 length:678 start_codon:yes stop_codon:yes gene_type:complete
MKKIIITGSEGLIGTEVARYLESTGNEIIRCDLQLGHDLTNEEFVVEFFRDNPADALINLFALNHHIEGGDSGATLMDISLESFELYMKVNLVSLFSVCREFVRYNTKGGSIINFSSIYGVVSPNRNIYNGEKHIGYSVSKSGVLMLSRHLATHLAPNIRVNTIVPGGVEHNQTSEFKDKYSFYTPIGRMMKVKEINGIVEYLISDKSSYTTGAEFKIDGGWTSW